MIDVLLTILVFFMTITSAQVLKVDKTIQLPIANGSSITRVIVDGHSDWGGQLAMRAL